MPKTGLGAAAGTRLGPGQGDPDLVLQAMAFGKRRSPTPRLRAADTTHSASLKRQNEVGLGGGDSHTGLGQSRGQSSPLLADTTDESAGLIQP